MEERETGIEKEINRQAQREREADIEKERETERQRLSLDRNTPQHTDHIPFLNTLTDSVIALSLISCLIEFLQTTTRCDLSTRTTTIVCLSPFIVILSGRSFFADMISVANPTRACMLARSVILSTSTVECVI